jgi:hypothetical protein
MRAVQEDVVDSDAVDAWVPRPEEGCDLGFTVLQSTGKVVIVEDAGTGEHPVCS